MSITTSRFCAGGISHEANARSHRARHVMNRRSFLRKASVTAAGFGVLRNVQACAPPRPTVTVPVTPLPPTFAGLRDRFFIYHLQRNPVTSTYLGGDGYSPELADSNTRLRDYRPQSLQDEIRFYRDVKAALARMAPAAIAPARGDTVAPPQPVGAAPAG